jgi:hypothetical protein
MTIRHHFIVFAGLTSAVIALPAVAAAPEPIQIQVQVSGTVPASCELGLDVNLTPAGAGTYTIGTLTRNCNAVHDLSFVHGVDGAPGRIVIDTDSQPLLTGSGVLVSSAGPTQSTAVIRLEGVDTATAQAVASSLRLQVSPSAF